MFTHKKQLQNPFSLPFTLKTAYVLKIFPSSLFFVLLSLKHTHKTNTHKQLFINISCNGARNEKTLTTTCPRQMLIYLITNDFIILFFSSNKATKKSFCSLSHSLTQAVVVDVRNECFIECLKVRPISSLLHIFLCFCLELDEHWYFAYFSHFLRIQT